MSIVLQALNQRPVAYYPLYKQLTGSLQGAVLLSQIMYWFSKKNKFYKTNKDLMQELNLTEAELKSGKRQIKKLPFITITREGIPSTTYYAIDWFEYENYINSSVGLNSPNCMGSKATNKLGEIHPTNSYTTTDTSHKELPKGNSPASGQSNKPNVDSRERNALKQTKKPSLVQTKHVRKETIEILEYWNSFDSLTTHTLKRKRTVAPLHEQTKTVQNIDCSLYKLLRGTLYTKHDGIQVGLKKKAWDIPTIKKTIERMSVACSPDYSTNSKRVSLLSFLFNPHVKLGQGANKYRYKYPFLHFINNKPVKIVNSPTRKKTDYPILVDRTIKKLTAVVKLTDKQYNQVVKQIDKAMVIIKAASNGNLAENRMRLPDLLYDTMIRNKVELSPDHLGLGVYHLKNELKRRGITR